MRSKRKGEFVCDCSAYEFPHRFGGGKCNGQEFVDEYWEKNLGQGECKTCSCFDEKRFECDVYTEGEPPKEGECFMSFVGYNEIKIYYKR